MADTLRSRIAKLAHAKPELRQHLVPLLRMKQSTKEDPGIEPFDYEGLLVALREAILRQYDSHLEGARIEKETYKGSVIFTFKWGEGFDRGLDYHNRLIWNDAKLARIRAAVARKWGIRTTPDSRVWKTPDGAKMFLRDIE